MAETTTNMQLRVPSRDGSDAADLANIIADLGDDVDGKLGVWQAFTPTMTIGGNTPPYGWLHSGRYARIGTTVHARITTITDGTSLGSGDSYEWSLPVAAYTPQKLVGHCLIVDENDAVENGVGVAWLTSTTTAAFRLATWGGARQYLDNVTIGDWLPPDTEATIYLSLTYEAA